MYFLKSIVHQKLQIVIIYSPSCHSKPVRLFFTICPSTAVVPNLFSWAPPTYTHGNLSPPPYNIYTRPCIYTYIYIYIYILIINGCIQSATHSERSCDQLLSCIPSTFDPPVEKHCNRMCLTHRRVTIRSTQRSIEILH